MNKNKIKLAHLGCGYISQAEHLPSHFLAHNVQLVAVIDTREQMAKAIAEKFGIEAFPLLEKCLKSVDVDAVDIVVPEDAHALLAIQAMEAGKHVLIEKPLARSVSEGQKMVESAKRNNVKLMVAYMRRYDTDCLQIKNMIDSGKLGEIRAGIGLFKLAYGARYFRLAEDSIEQSPTGTPSPPDALPRDKILDQLIHHFNLSRFWLGKVGDIIVFHQQNQVIQIVLKFEGGALVTLMHLDGMGNGEECWIFGTEGNVHTKLWSPHIPYQFPKTVVFDRRNHTKTEVVMARLNPYTTEIVHFAECVLEDKEPRSSGADSLKDLELIQKIHDSQLAIIKKTEDKNKAF